MKAERVNRVFMDEQNLRLRRRQARRDADVVRAGKREARLRGEQWRAQFEGLGRGEEQRAEQDRFRKEEGRAEEEGIGKSRRETLVEMAKRMRRAAEGVRRRERECTAKEFWEG